MLSGGKVGHYLLAKYGEFHDIKTDRALFHYAMDIKRRYMRNAPLLDKVIYDSDIQLIKRALGMNTAISRIHGGKLKAKNEIRIAAVFRSLPQEFLRMIVVHELAHLREKDHNKAFYGLCRNMEPNYHQLEFDLRLYLTHLEITGQQLWLAPDKQKT